MPESSSLPFAGTDQFRIGVLTNPRSGGNRKGGGALAAFLQGRPDLVQAKGSTPTTIKAALSTLAAQQVDLLVINGGDGTVQATLTALYGEDPRENPPPLLALLRSGTSSMLARDVGVDGTPLEALRRIVTR
ncbi:MAG: acylglycerol kinase family protein, partial [Desulfuromonadaceae bacterium]